MRYRVLKECLKYFRVVIFMLVVVIVVECVDYACLKTGYIWYIVHEADNSGEQDYDCVVIGASHGRAAIDPQAFIDAGYASNPINMCIQGASLPDNYYMLREVCQNNDVKKVILDIDYQYMLKDSTRDADFGNLQVYAQLPFSSVKLEYIANELMDKDFRTTYFKKFAYELTLEDIKDNVAKKSTDAYKNYDISAAEGLETEGEYLGRGFFYRNKPVDQKGEFKTRTWSETDISANAVKYLKKIVDYCEKNDIELVCITSPITPTTYAEGSPAKACEYIAGLCEEYGAEYINFNEACKGTLDIDDSDYSDWDGHMNGELAEQFSALLAQTLNEK